MANTKNSALHLFQSVQPAHPRGGRDQGSFAAGQRYACRSVAAPLDPLFVAERGLRAFENVATAEGRKILDFETQGRVGPHIGLAHRGFGGPRPRVGGGQSRVRAGCARQGVTQRQGRRRCLRLRVLAKGAGRRQGCRQGEREDRHGRPSRPRSGHAGLMGLQVISPKNEGARGRAAAPDQMTVRTRFGGWSGPEPARPFGITPWGQCGEARDVATAGISPALSGTAKEWVSPPE